MASADESDLARLSTDELGALRLAAQVMAHRAQLSGRPQVGLYFESLESAVMAEQAARSQVGRTIREPVRLLALTGSDDRRQIGEYLQLLVANEGLSDSIRRFCADLVARDAIGPQ